MPIAAKYAVVKQRKRSPFTVVGAEEFEARADARADAKAKNKSAVNYKFVVVTLKPGKIKRPAGVLGNLLKDIGAPIKTPTSK